jgi:cellulose synthase/poly-beta-1,6-N-acetylglucosamine synthase-like glycosyltransferase
LSARLGVPRDQAVIGPFTPLSVDTAVSFVMPARDASLLMPDCLTRLLPQMRQDDELIVAAADEPTAEAAREASGHDPRLRIVANPASVTPAGLNRAVEIARHPVVIRIDAQSLIPADYRERLIGLLTTTEAVNVGGRQVALGVGRFQAAVALAMNSPLGHGGAAYRQSEAGGPVRAVDTVYLGAYRREALVRIGGFDERFTTNQDAELNERLRRAGGIILLDPSLEVGYLPRASVRALARQFRAYGRGRRATVRRHPGSLSVRQLAAPALVGSLALSAVLAVAGAFAGALGSGADWTPVPFMLTSGGYVSLIILGALLAARRELTRAPAVALALTTMHLSWGVGFLAHQRH